MKTSSNANIKSETLYCGADVPLRVIRRFAKEVAAQFQPHKIILFGSHAYGQPHADSDVDILIVMPTRNQLDQAVKIHWALSPPFPVHLVVRTPHNLAWRLAEGESFLTEVILKGKVLYQKQFCLASVRRKPDGFH